MIEENDKKELEIKRKLSLIARTMRNLYPFLLIFSSISIIIIISLMLLAKTQSFRHWSSGLILNLVNNELQEGARFEFDDINFSYLLGFRIDNARLIVKNDTLLNCKHLHTGLSILPLLRNKIVVNEVLIIDPKFNVYRSTIDSNWNYEKIFIPSTDTTPMKPMDWLVRLKRIRIKNGSAWYFDSTLAFKHTGKIDYNHLKLNNINLNIKGEVNLANFSFDFDLEKFSFKETNSKFGLKNLSSKIKIDTNGIKVKDFTLETDGIELVLDASLDSLNIFSEYPDAEKAKFKVETSADKIALKEISKFIPTDILLTGILEYELYAEGRFNNFKVVAENFNLDNSELNLKARFINITDSTRKAFIYMNNSNISENDVNRLIRPFNISGIPSFKHAKIPELKVNYMSDSLNVNFNIESELGNAKGNVSLGFDSDFYYSGKISTEKVNIAKIVNDKALASDINTNIEFSGEGSKPEDILLKLKVDLFNSSFAGYEVSKTILDFQTPEKGVFIIDSLFIELAKRYDTVSTIQRTNKRPNQSLFLSANLNMKNPNKPFYKLYSRINSIRFSRLFDNNVLPTVVDAVLSVNGEGFNPDSIIGDINFKIERWRFARKNLKPLELQLNISHNENGQKSIILKSDLLNIESTGKYKIASLQELVEYHTPALTDFIKEKISVIANDSLPYVSNSIVLNPSSDEINAKIKMEFKDLEYLKTFLKFKELKLVMNMDLNLSSDNNNLHIDLNYLNIANFILDDSTHKVRCEDLKINGSVALNRNDSYSPEFNLAISTVNPIYIDKNDIQNFNSKMDFSKDNLVFYGRADLNNRFSLETNFNSQIIGNSINLEMNKLSFKFSDMLNLYNIDNIKLTYHNGMIDIDKFKISGNNFKTIELKGKAGLDRFDNLTIKLKDYKIEEIWKLIPAQDKQFSEMIKGRIDSMYILVNGTYQNTDINLKLSAIDLHINGSKLGNISADLKHNNSILSGSLEAFSQNEADRRNLLKINIKQFPMNFSIESKHERFSENEPISLAFETKRFPLDYLSPFVLEIKKLRGFVDIKLDITGNNLKNIDYSGYVKFDKTGFLLEANNLNYLAEGHVTVNKDDIFIEKISLKNEKADLSGGEIIAKGHLFLDNLEPKSMDMNISSKKFKIMSQATMKAMPSMYGDFIISLGPKPLHIYGSFKEPNIRGDLNIVRATLNMPNTISTEVKKSKLKYEFITNENVEFTFIDDPLQKPSGRIETKKAEENKNNFTNQMDIDLGIRFLGRFIVTMDITEMGQLFAEIGSATNEDVLRYVQTRGSDEPKIYGTDIIVKNGSTLKLIKMFETTGKVSFPTGIVSNPGLDLIAVYRGQRVVSEKTKSYTVNMFIKGTKDSPIITFGYSEDDNPVTGDSSKINEDALLLLTFGKTKEDFQNSSSGLSSNLQKNAGQIANNLTSSMASSFASSALTDFLQTTGFIQNVEIDIGNTLTSLDQARLKWSGDIYGVKYTLGGTVADFANNNEISFDFPLIARSNIPWLNHFIIQLTGTTGTSNASTIGNQKVWEVKLKLGGSW